MESKRNIKYVMAYKCSSCGAAFEEVREKCDHCGGAVMEEKKEEGTAGAPSEPVSGS